MRPDPPGLSVRAACWRCRTIKDRLERVITARIDAQCHGHWPEGALQQHNSILDRRSRSPSSKVS
jgi:hypothetical protein